MAQANAHALLHVARRGMQRQPHARAHGHTQHQVHRPYTEATREQQRAHGRACLRLRGLTRQRAVPSRTVPSPKALPRSADVRGSGSADSPVT